MVDLSWSSSRCSLVILLIDPQLLLETARKMAGFRLTPTDWQQRIQDIHLWPTRTDSVAPCLPRALSRMMELAVHLVGFSQSIINQLKLDDQIYRILAMMMFPEWLMNNPLEKLKRRQEQQRDGFDDLLDFIRQHLQEPLGLSRLTQQSHYSRRSLQYAFRTRLGCTASQWIRDQRLDLASQLLQTPDHHTTVSSVAAACGYRSKSLFSVDFQQRFQVKPSQLLREARLRQPP